MRNLPAFLAHYQGRVFNRIDLNRVIIWCPTTCSACKTPLSLHQVIVSEPNDNALKEAGLEANHFPVPALAHKPWPGDTSLCPACYEDYLSPSIHRLAFPFHTV